MATALWGQVYYQEEYAGILQQEPSGRCIFTYDSAYLSSDFPAIAFTLPKQHEPHVSAYGLHPFFDNLVAEGWLEAAQERALNVSNDRFALLLGFGYDLAGAVSVRDPKPQNHQLSRITDVVKRAAAKGRASLSGIQGKLLLVEDNKLFRPVGPNELSTHIAKLPSEKHEDILELEFLSTLAVKELLPADEVVELKMDSIQEINDKHESIDRVLIIKRFDRTVSGKRRHFEEFSQLLGRLSRDKYEVSYEELGQFIISNPQCAFTEVERLFRRIIVALLIGNTDAHAKNFAMLYGQKELTLTPSYDLVAAAAYKDYQTIAMSIAGAKDLQIGQLKAKHLVQLGLKYQFSRELIEFTITKIGEQLPHAIAKIDQSEVGTKVLHDKLITLMEKRWKGSFALIGKVLARK